MKESSSNNIEEVISSESDSNQLFQQIPIEDTPFTAVKMNDKWFLTLGKYRLTEPLDTLLAVQQDAERADWWRVIQIMTAVVEQSKTESNTK